MRRRNLLAGIPLAVLPGFVTGAGGGKTRRLRMVTDWPEGPGLFPSAVRLARTIEAISDGRIEIEVFPAGALVRPLETLDAVRSGIADFGHTHFGYYGSMSSAFQFYSGVPFGLTPSEMLTWVRFGGGQALWDELGARFDLKPLLCSSTGTQMGGWFREPIDSLADIGRLRYRMAGLGAEVYRELGAAIVLLPPGDIVPALRSGAIDACEWAGPWLDMEMGLHRAAAHYYHPGWHEPSGVVSLAVNTGVWESFGADERRLIETAATNEYALSLAEFDARNAEAFARLGEDPEVELHRFDDRLLARFAEIGADVVAAAGDEDALARRVHASHERFLRDARPWSEASVKGYLDVRGVPG